MSVRPAPRMEVSWVPQRSGTSVVGLGELLWDCFEDTRLPGGAPANVAFHAQQMGHRGLICSRIGEDDLGRELLEYLQARGLDTRQIQQDPRWPTGRVTVDASRPEHPSFVIHEDAAWDHLVFNEVLEEIMHEASAVCFGTLAQRSPQSRGAIYRALEAGSDALIVYDVNLRQSWYRREWIEHSMRFSNLVKLNWEEAGILAGILDTGSDDPKDLAAFLRTEFETEVVCITRAERGCLIFGQDSTVEVRGRQVEVADSVGAGDAFTAALVSASLRGWSLEMSAEFANQVGALVAGQPGAMPELQEEFAALIAQMEDQSR